MNHSSVHGLSVYVVIRYVGNALYKHFVMGGQENLLLQIFYGLALRQKLLIMAYSIMASLAPTAHLC